MDLYILRHAIAVEASDGANDFERPLTPAGEQKLRRVIKAMRRLDLSFDLILSSPYVRARQTAEMVAKTLARKEDIRLWESLGADSTPREFVAELRTVQPTPTSALAVGHEPFLSSLVGLLVQGNGRSCVTLKKAGLCKLQVDTMRLGRCASLEWLLTPRQMQLMT